MRAGKLRHLIHLQRQVLTADGQGGYANDWTDIDEIHAEVKFGGGTESLIAGQLETASLYTISMRWRADLTPAKRVVWEDGNLLRILDVLSVGNPDGKHRELALSCIERTPGPGPTGL